MPAFKNRFWGVKHLAPANGNSDTPEAQFQQVEPYLDWRLLALEHNAILLCSAARPGGDLHAQDLIIIEDALMVVWLTHNNKC